MSMIYVPARQVPFEELVRALPVMGLTFHQTKVSRPDCQCVTDGEDFAWIETEDGSNFSLTRYGVNYVGDVVKGIESHFDVEMVCELDERFPELLDGTGVITLHLGE